LHVIGALSNKRAELAGIVRQLEQQLVQQRTNLAHLDATMRLFDPDIQPKQIRAKQSRVRSVWFRPGECLRLIYDELRDAAQPITTREWCGGVLPPGRYVNDHRDQALAGNVRDRLAEPNRVVPPKPNSLSAWPRRQWRHVRVTMRVLRSSPAMFCQAPSAALTTIDAK
jgi:hypothetical protein